MTKNALKYGVAHIKFNQVFWFLLATIVATAIATPWAWAVGGIAVAWELYLGYGYALLYTKAKKLQAEQLDNALAALLKQDKQAKED